MNIRNIPKSLQADGLFCVWKYIPGEKKPRKCLFNPLTGEAGASNDPKTFGTFAQAKMAYDMGGYEGLGVGIFGDICCIDVDNCFDENGALTDLAEEIVAEMQSFTELSPSGTGLHIWFRANDFPYDKEKYYINNQKVGVEAYVAGATKKFVTITGDRISEGWLDPQERSSELQRVLDKHMLRDSKPTKKDAPTPVNVTLDLSDQDIIDLASKHGDKFGRLWNGDTSGYGASGQNEADLALCCKIAWYTKDPDQIDRIFRCSGLMRDKWDRRQSGSTYGRITIDKALNFVTDQYGAKTVTVQPMEPVPSFTEPVSVPFPTDRDENVEVGMPVGSVQLIPGPRGPEKSARNVKRILTMDPNLLNHIYWCKFAARIRVVGQLPWPSEPGLRDWDNADDACFRNYVEEYIVGVAKGQVNDALTEISKRHAVDTLAATLDALVWDGKPRIDTALQEYCGADYTEYNSWAFKHWLVGSVMRWYKGGSKLDEMLVLYGHQGAGKSSFLKRLCPRKEWVLPNIPRIDDKDAMQVLRGKALVIMDEMLAQKRADKREAIKAYLTSETDTYRPSYGVRDETHERRCSFAGSTNELYFLSDRTGNRRYLPVTCDVSKATKSHLIFDESQEVEAEFMQIVAEAVSIYKSGYVVAILHGSKEEAMQKAELAKYMEEDSREGIIEEFLRNTRAERVCAPMLSFEALGGSKTPSKREGNEIHQIMGGMPGWERYDKNGGRARCGNYGLQICYVRDNTSRYSVAAGQEVDLLD